MYQIAFDPSRPLIRVKLGGLLCAVEIGQYIADLRAQFVEHRFKAGYLMLIDTTAAAIQPQDVLASLAEHMASFPKAGRIAVVTGASLARMQVRRMMKQPYLRIVTTVSDAEQWLFSPPSVSEAQQWASAAA